MRKKTPKAVVTFASTSDAMAVEAAARETGLPGRMIPIPSEVSAGCGLAWDLISGQQHDFGGGSQLPPYSAFFWKMER